MAFTYEQVYWLDSPWEADSMALTGALPLGPSQWIFYKGGEDTPTRTMAFEDLQFMPDGSAVGFLRGVSSPPFRFIPAQPDAVRADPSAYGLTPEEATRVLSPSDVYLYVHASRVPDWYLELNANPSLGEQVSSPVFEERGVPAPVGSLHYWKSRDQWYVKMPDGSWKVSLSSDEWADSHPDLPTDSLRAHTTPDGVLSPERQRLHAQIIDGIFAGKRRTKNPVAVFTMGLPASGKSTLTRDQRMRSSNFATLDPDDHREHLPEFQAAKALKARNGATIVHNEVSELNDKALEKAMADDPEAPGEHYSFVLDGVGANLAFYQSTLEKALKKGYEVHVILAHVRDEEGLAATDRVKIRAEDRGRRSGRFVLPSVIDRVRPLLPENFRALSQIASSATVMDVTDPESVRPMYSKRGDDEQGNPRWMNEAAAGLDGLDAILALYVQAVKDDAAKYASEEPKFLSGEGINDPLLDPSKV